MPLLLLLLVCCLATAADTKDPDPPSPYINLKGFANQKLKDDVGRSKHPNNNLAALPTGMQTLAGVKFRIGDGLMHLGSDMVKGKPDKIAGVKVGLALDKLHFLHAACFDAPEGTVVARYVVHYADKTKAEVEVAYGKDVVDWWDNGRVAAPKAAKVAWVGENDAATKFRAKVRLYLMTWKNPHPRKEVATIDFVATAADTGAAPFCVAITAEK